MIALPPVVPTGGERRIRNVAKIDKDYELRMQGMIYAYNLVKEKGIEGLERDMKLRNVLRAPMKFTASQIEEFWDMLSRNLYNTIMTVTGIALHEEFGFGKDRLHRWKKAFDRATVNATDMDYIGTNYVTLEDYAVYLNSKYDMGIDTDVVAVCQDSNNDTNPAYHMCKVDRLIEIMRKDGYEDAAEYLEKKVS